MCLLEIGVGIVSYRARNKRRVFRLNWLCLMAKLAALPPNTIEMALEKHYAINEMCSKDIPVTQHVLNSSSLGCSVGHPIYICLVFLVLQQSVTYKSVIFPHCRSPMVWSRGEYILSTVHISCISGIQ